MKKYLFLLTAGLLLSMGLLAQSIPQPETIPANYPPISFEGDEIVNPEPVPLQNCNRASPNFPYYNNNGNYVPDNNTPVKNIEVILNVFQKSDGTGNFTPATKAGLILLMAWVNANYANSDSTSDPISGVQFIADRKIQFDIGPVGQERIYFYPENTNTLWNGNCDYHLSQMREEVWGTGPLADPQRRKYLNIFFTEGSVCGRVENSFIQINSGGSGYTSPPTVTFTRVGPVPGQCPFDATGTAQISGGQVVGVTITNSGGGYYYPPTITFSGGGGSGASAIVKEIASGASGCAVLPSYGEAGDVYHVIYKAYTSYVNGNLWVNNIVLRHEIAHNLGLCHTYLGGGCSANCNTSDPNFFDDVFGNPSNCPHNADWGTDAFDPNLPTPATSGKVTNNILGGNQAQGYASPKQIGEMHRSLALKNIRKYVDPCTYTPLQPIVISSSEYWDFDIRLYSDLIIQAGATLDLACKITMPCGSKIHVMPGAKLIMQNGSEIIMHDDAHFFVDQGGILEYDDGIITLNGTNTLLEIKGTLDIKSNATFSFTGNGFVKFSSPPLPAKNFLSDNIIAGAGSKMIFTGSGKSDKVLEITQESLYPPANLAEFTIQNGTVELGSGSRINPFGLSTQIKLLNSLFTSTTRSFNNHRGIHLYGQSGVQVDNCTFEYGKYGIFAFLTYGGAPLTINTSVFQNCSYGLFSTDKGVILNSCRFSDCFINGWEARGMSFPCAMNSGTVNQNETGISFSNPAGGGLFVNNSNITQNLLSGIDFSGSGMLSIQCGAVRENGLSLQGSGIRLSNNATLNMSTSFKAGRVNAAGNYTTIESNCANTFYLAQGRNDFRPAVGGKIVKGTVSNSCAYQIIAANNQWKNNLAQPVQPADYSLTNCACAPKQVKLLDAKPQPPVACPVSPPQIANPNAALSTPLDFCPNCPDINTASFSNVKLNEAVKQSIAQTELDNPSGNDITALQLFYEILTTPIAQKHDRFDWLGNLSYTKMKETFGNAFFTGRTSDFSSGNVSVQQLLAAQDTLIARAAVSGNSSQVFYLTFDKGLIYRFINDRKKALELMDNISSCTPLDSAQSALLSQARNLVFAEYLVLSGEVPKENFEQLLQGNLFSFISPTGINISSDTGLAASTHCAGDTIQFRPSVFAKTYSWDFGNGSMANTASASATYTATGAYTVSLITTTECSADTFTQTIAIIDKPMANFNVSDTIGVAPLEVTFTNTTTGSGNITYQWDFGDGNSSTDQSPAHIYSSAGAYTVCLIAANQCGSDTFCSQITVLSAHCSPVTVLPPAQPAANVALVWAQQYNAGNVPHGVGFAVDAHGCVLISGVMQNTQIVTVKYSRDGTEQWVKTYANPGATFDNARPKLKIDNNCNVYVGFTYIPFTGAANTDIVVVKYDSLGTQHWAATYNGPGGSTDLFTGLALDNSGNVYVSGSAYVDGTNNSDLLIVKYNNSGAQQWAALHNGSGSGNDAAVSVAADNSGNVYAAGSAVNSSGNSDWTTIKYNSAGTQLWASDFNGQDNLDDIAVGLTLDNTDNIIVTGTSRTGANGYDFATVKYNSNGVQQWAAHYDYGTQSDEAPVAIATDNSGNIVITGRSGSLSLTGLGVFIDLPLTFTYSQAIITIKYSPLGMTQWVKPEVSQLPPSQESINAVTGLALDSEGNAYINGYSYHNPSCQGGVVDISFLTIKYSSQGTLDWRKIYIGNPPGTLVPISASFGISVPHVNEVYITGASGSSFFPSNYAITTIKYEESLIPPGSNSDNAIDLDSKDTCASNQPMSGGEMWFRFVATDPHMTISVRANNGTVTSLAALYQGFCNNLQGLISTSGTGTFLEIDSTVFGTGQNYFLKVTGTATDINVCIPSCNLQANTRNDAGNGGISNEQANFSKIYPNPNDGNMNVQYTIPENETGEFELHDLVGRKQFSYILQGEQNTLAVSQQQLTEGVYFYRIVSNGNVLQQGKIIVIKN